MTKTVLANRDPHSTSLRYCIGLMSGTSLDGADGVLLEFPHEAVDASPLQLRVCAHAHRSFPASLLSQLQVLQSSGPNELDTAARASIDLARTYAEVVQSLLSQSGLAAASISAIGAHGQTLRHQPLPSAKEGAPRGGASPTAWGYTIQINQPALLAELSGIDVVADFRSRDIAAGGQGAPLVPAFHAALFASSNEVRAVLNVGGIANISLLSPSSSPDETPAVLAGFDCGPGNVLMDSWCLHWLGQSYDHQGAWAAQGQLIPSLLQLLMSEPFIHMKPPKSTGRDLFNGAWLLQRLKVWAQDQKASEILDFLKEPTLSSHLRAQSWARDVQATLSAYTAHAVHHALVQSAPDVSRLLVCGGGAYNTHLLKTLQQLMPLCPVETTQAHGLAPEEVEAAAFAWLARQTLLRRPGNLPQVTGAHGPRVLGAIYPR